MAVCEDGSRVIAATFCFVIEGFGLRADRLESFFECPVQQKALLAQLPEPRFCFSEGSGNETNEWRKRITKRLQQFFFISYVTHISSEQAVFEGLLSLFPLSSSWTIVNGSTPP